MSKPDGWSKFLYLAFRSPEGREAFHAYREQRARLPWPRRRS